MGPGEVSEIYSGSIRAVDNVSLALFAHSTCPAGTVLQNSSCAAVHLPQSCNALALLISQLFE
jgi:hypothetical protein